MATATRVNVRTMLSEFIREVYEQAEEVDTLALCKAARNHFDKNDDFTDALIREALYMLVPTIAEEVRNSFRRERAQNPDATTRERMASIFAHIGDTKHRSLLTMTKGEHLFAAEEREGQARTQLQWASFHRAIAALHSDDECLTRDCLTDPQLDRLWEEHLGTK